MNGEARPPELDVIETPRGVAVVADTYWQALKGRDALEVEWDDTAAEKRGTGTLFETYRRQYLALDPLT